MSQPQATTAQDDFSLIVDVMTSALVSIQRQLSCLARTQADILRRLDSLEARQIMKPGGDTAAR